jgi:hypothetical protein
VDTGGRQCLVQPRKVVRFPTTQAGFRACVLPSNIHPDAQMVNLGNEIQNTSSPSWKAKWSFFGSSFAQNLIWIIIGNNDRCLLKVERKKKLLLVTDKKEALSILVSPGLKSVWYERNVEIILLHSPNICHIIGTVSTTWRPNMRTRRVSSLLVLEVKNQHTSAQMVEMVPYFDAPFCTIQYSYPIHTPDQTALPGWDTDSMPPYCYTVYLYHCNNLLLFHKYCSPML